MPTLRVALPPPLDVGGSLSGLGRWGDDLIDRWDGQRWLRALWVAGRSVPVRVAAGGTVASPVLLVSADAASVAAVATHVAGLFVTAPAALAELAARDAVVAAADRRFPGVRPVLQPDPLTALVRSISAQQVNLRWAAEIRRRLAERYGRPLEVHGERLFALEAEPLANARVEDLRALQLTGVKSAAVIGVARAVLDGLLNQEELAGLDDGAVTDRLVRLHGIGRWSAEWFLARGLGRPVVAAGDLGVRKAVGRAYFGGRMPSEAEVRSATAHWGPAAGVAQQLLLHGLTVESASAPARSAPPAP
jgi:DNA-3-methyladenine glycosylase II